MIKMIYLITKDTICKTYHFIGLSPQPLFYWPPAFFPVSHNALYCSREGSCINTFVLRLKPLYCWIWLYLIALTIADLGPLSLKLIIGLKFGSSFLLQFRFSLHFSRIYFYHVFVNFAHRQVLSPKVAPWLVLPTSITKYYLNKRSIQCQNEKWNFEVSTIFHVTTDHLGMRMVSEIITKMNRSVWFGSFNYQSLNLLS